MSEQFTNEVLAAQVRAAGTRPVRASLHTSTYGPPRRASGTEWPDPTPLPPELSREDPETAALEAAIGLFYELRPAPPRFRRDWTWALAAHLLAAGWHRECVVDAEIVDDDDEDVAAAIFKDLDDLG